MCVCVCVCVCVFIERDLHSSEGETETEPHSLCFSLQIKEENPHSSSKRKTDGGPAIPVWSISIARERKEGEQVRGRERRRTTCLLSVSPLKREMRNNRGVRAGSLYVRACACVCVRVCAVCACV